MPITFEEVQHVARLARLELDERELLEFQGELNALLGHFEDIQGPQTPGAASATHGVKLANVWSGDVVERSLDPEDVLKNAPVSRGGLFVVPAIIEE